MNAILQYFQLIWKWLYSSDSATDHGSMFQLCNLVNRSNVKSVPKDNVNACEDFFCLLVTSHILVVAMELLGMESLDDEPNQEIVQPDVWMCDREERQSVLHTISSLMVSESRCSFKNSTGVIHSDDKVHAYACELLGLGLFFLEFSDAIREGDGVCVVRCWRYLLLLYRASHKVNYAIEAFTLLAQRKFLHLQEKHTR